MSDRNQRGHFVTDNTPSEKPTDQDSAPSRSASTSPPVVATVVGPPVFQEIRATREQPPLRLRELLIVLTLVVLSDLTIYRGEGFAGYALLLVVAPLLLMFGTYRPQRGPFVWLVSVLLLAAAAKLFWCGSALLVGCGFVLLIAFAMTLSGLTPYIVEAAVFFSQLVPAGYEGLVHYLRGLSGTSRDIPRVRWLNYILPLLTVLLFSSIFILANPDLLDSFSEQLRIVVESFRDWIVQFAPGPLEILFWAVIAWLSIGLLRPLFAVAMSAAVPDKESPTPEAPAEPSEARLYGPFRNTLVMVILLFTLYLVFEFKTLWFRVFEEGFYYAGYAHKGAAWLTVALAFATLLLSLVFRGSVLRDPRAGRLRWLAWIWSLQNLVLAAAVYNRLWIYVDFNGMTRMRTIGIFGMTAVAVGFILVLYKIAQGRSFLWLVRGHLWTLAAAVFLFSLTPVDTIVVRYNTNEVLAGNLAPSVQISVHPINAEGVLRLVPLLESEDEIIREGVRAMLAQRYEESLALALRREQQGWTAHQASDQVVLDGLKAVSDQLSVYEDKEKRDAALTQFHEYVYQWY